MELAVAKLAISTLSPIINKLGSYVYDSYFGGDVTAEDMENLTTVILPTIKTVIQEAELLPLQHLGPWLEKLHAAAFEAEDLIDLYEYNRIKNQVSSLPELMKNTIGKTKKTLNFMLPKSSFKESIEKLQKLAEEAAGKLLPLIESARNTAMIKSKYKSPQASSITSTVSTLSSPLFGRDEECNNIIQMLQVNESHADSTGRFKRIPVIAIKGIGGSGKTSTAQGVYNDKRVEIFDLKMWVHVSRGFDVHRLTKEIIESATIDKCPPIENLDALQTKLKQSISTKKFLLVLDDVWCEDKMQWDQLLSPLNEVKGNGSKIIMTTRMEKVASVLQVDQVIYLEELKTEDCWSILKHYAFGNFETTIEDTELAHIGNQIISKVKYSPLALRVVGSLLYNRVNDWENILRQDILKETMDVLFLSFQYLPSHLQRCVAYCSLFPKGYKFYIYREELVPLWIAQGFVEITNESELTLEEKGRIYIEELLSYSFFEIDEDYYSGSYYKMHDLLHDVAEKVSKKYCHRIEVGSLDIPTTCIHLSMYWMESLKKVDIFDMLKLKNLRTLIILDDFDIENIPISEKRKVKFPNPTKLRAMKTYLPMEALSNIHIDRQKHLRYLKVKYDGKLNRSLLAKLYHLQFFYCYKDGTHGCRFVQGFENLINLRTLKLDNCDYHPKLNIKKLTSLQNLTVFHTNKDGENGIVPLKSLNLHGSLSIKNLENIKSEAESAKAMLSKKRNLNELTFEWSSTVNNIDGSKSCEDVLEGLEPHPNLQRLSIECYQGVKSPNWMTSENSRLLRLQLDKCGSLKEVSYLPPRLEELCVEECNDLIQLPPIGHTLRTLRLINCSKLTPPSMSSESLCLTQLEIRRCARNECQLFNDLPFLANLQYLDLEGFSELETFPNLSPTVTSLRVGSFSRLTSLGNLQRCTALSYLHIYDCNMLTGLESLQYCTSLCHLHINDCNMLTGLESLQNCISLKYLIVRRGMLIMTDGSIFGDGDINMCLPYSIEHLEITNRKKAYFEKEGYPSRDCLTDLQVQTLLDGFIRPFPPLLEDNLYHLSSLQGLSLEGFTTLPSLEKFSSLRELDILRCPDVELLPNLPISLQLLVVAVCPKLKVKYEKGGPLHSTISHIRGNFIMS